MVKALQVTLTFVRTSVCPRRGSCHCFEQTRTKNIYKVFLVVVFNVWNGVTTGTLVVPTFQEGTTIFSPLRRWGSNPGRWHGEPKSTTARTEAQSSDTTWSTYVIRHYIITIVTRDDKRDKFTLQTDLSKCGHACEPHDRLLSLAMRAKVKATTSIVVALSIQWRVRMPPQVTFE